MANLTIIRETSGLFLAEDISAIYEDGKDIGSAILETCYVLPIYGYTAKQVTDYINRDMPAHGRYCQLPVAANTWTSIDNLVKVDAWNDGGTWRKITVIPPKHFTIAGMPQIARDILASSTSTQQQRAQAVGYIINKVFTHPDNQEAVN